MKIITDERCTGYSHAGHPERPERVSATLARLRGQTDLEITWGKPGPVAEEVLLRAHTADHLKRLREPEDFDTDTPCYPKIDEFARASAGAALEALKAARDGQTVFSLMRPPGHHATKHRAMGFCYLSNAAIVALEALALGVKRVAVYDFDVHHGNGTEAILLNQAGAWFASVHQHPCYPGTGTRNVGNNCFNFPLAPRTPRPDYRHTLAAALEHLLTFKPGLLVISAGFDPYKNDPIAQETLEVEDFHWLGGELRKTGLPVCNLLEGGYSNELPDLILAYLKGIEGK
jgi:acetoin utilization deacetylase AcuC-like enzyme